MMKTIQSREKQSERHSTCFRAKGTQCDSPGQRPGKMRNECSKPQRGEMTVHPHYALSGLPRSKLPFPGAMPQAFTFCRVAARPSENAIRVDGIKTGSARYPNEPNFGAGQGGTSRAQAHHTGQMVGRRCRLCHPAFSCGKRLTFDIIRRIIACPEHWTKQDDFR